MEMFPSMPYPVANTFVDENHLLLLTWTSHRCLSVTYNSLSAQIKTVMSLTFSHRVAWTSHSTKICFLFQAFYYLIFLEVYHFLYWTTVLSANLTTLFSSEFNVFRCKLRLNLVYFLYKTPLWDSFSPIPIYVYINVYSHILLEQPFL